MSPRKPFNANDVPQVKRPRIGRRERARINVEYWEEINGRLEQQEETIPPPPPPMDTESDDSESDYSQSVASETEGINRNIAKRRRRGGRFVRNLDHLEDSDSESERESTSSDTPDPEAIDNNEVLDPEVPDPEGIDHDDALSMISGVTDHDDDAVSARSGKTNWSDGTLTNSEYARVLERQRVGDLIEFEATEASMEELERELEQEGEPDGEVAGPSSAIREPRDQALLNQLNQLEDNSDGESGLWFLYNLAAEEDYYNTSDQHKAHSVNDIWSEFCETYATSDGENPDSERAMFTNIMNRLIPSNSSSSLESGVLNDESQNQLDNTVMNSRAETNEHSEVMEDSMDDITDTLRDTSLTGGDSDTVEEDDEEEDLTPRNQQSPDGSADEDLELEQGHENLFCPEHLVGFWSTSYKLLHNHHMHPAEGRPSFDSLPMYQPINALDCITQRDFNLNGYDFKDVRNLVQCVHRRLYHTLANEISSKKGIKASLRFYIEFERIIPSDHLDNWIYAWFNNIEGERGAEGTMKILLHPSEIPDFVKRTLESVEDRVAKFVKATSGLRVNRIIHFRTVTIEYSPLEAGTYVPTPWLLKEYKGNHVINVNNSEEKCRVESRVFDAQACFFWSLLAARRVVRRVNRGGMYMNGWARKSIQETMDTYRRSLKSLKGLEKFSLPMTLNQVKIFERLNPEYRVVVLGFEDKYANKEKYDPTKYKGGPRAHRLIAHRMIKECLYPLYVSKNNNPDAITISLILLENEGTGHFIAVKDMNKLLAGECRNNQHYCPYCLQTFGNEQNLITHQRFCAQLGCQKPKFPVGDAANLKFRNYGKMIPVAFKVFADFESRLIDIPVPHTVPKMNKVPNHHQYVYQRGTTGGKTKYLQKHTMVGYAYVVVDSKNSVYSYKTYLAESDSEDVVETFLKDIQELGTKLRAILVKQQKKSFNFMLNAPEDISDELIREQKSCYFCDEPLFLTSETKYPALNDALFDHKYDMHTKWRTVRHHSHETLEFIALAHSSCNLVGAANLSCPVFFHNLSGYDGHSLILGLDKMGGSISIIPNSGEKYMAINWVDNSEDKKHKAKWNLTFLDSYRFLNSSLSTQGKILAQIGPEAFPTTKAIFEECYPNAKDNISLLYQKQVYPYDFVKSVQDFQYDRLPDQSEFYDKLRDEPLADELYAFAGQVWNAFDIKSMGEWTMLYNLADVTILADAYTKFEEICFREFKLDPANFLSLPSVSWTAALKHTKVELRLLTDNDQYQFIESALRGGYAGGGDIRYAESNNPYCPDFDPEKETTYIAFLDANQLYPYALSGCLPVGNFTWVPESELELFTQERIMSLGEEDSEGYFFEVDLSFDEKDHDRFNAYPPCPVRRTVDESEMSPYQQNLMEKLNLSTCSLKTPKLIADLTPRKHYVIHYSELKRYIDVGVRLDRIHRALRFDQRPWMHSFVELCTNKRAAATDAYESFFWKIFINSAYGKSCEQKRDRKRVNVVKLRKSAINLAKKATISDIMIISETMVLITMKTVAVKLDTPIYTGVTCLAKSKAHMTDFFYNFLIKQYGHENVSLLLTDTDSVGVLLRCEDVYRDMRDPEISSKWLDRSDYLPNDPILGEGMYDATNRKVRGKFKDVSAVGGPIKRLCFLKAKLYAYQTVLDYLEMKAKGVDRNFVKKKLCFDDYKRVLFSEDGERTTATSKRFQSLAHRIYTVETTKTALSTFDNKRHYVNNITSLAYGHYKIPRPNV